MSLARIEFQLPVENPLGDDRIAEDCSSSEFRSGSCLTYFRSRFLLRASAWTTASFIVVYENARYSPLRR
jgi:hypothetical protein